MIRLVLFLALIATPAAADPVSAITAISTWVAGLGVVGGALFKIGAGLAISALANALAPKQKVNDGGIRSDGTIAGGTNSQSFILGRYATAGNLVCPLMSWGTSGDTPNANRVFVVDLSDKEIEGVSKVWVDGVEFDASSVPVNPSDALRGTSLTNADNPEYDNRVHMRFWDGSQTAVDGYLLDKFNTRTERPWTGQMVGVGVSYAVMTFAYNRAAFRSDPRVLFEVQGIRLYDPRLDSTAGGVGSHRWGDESTYEATDNPVVMIYNIVRGISFADGEIWGLQAPADSLPFSTWAAAMNACDDNAGVFYKAGYEVRIAEDEPHDVIDQLLASCSAEFVDVGGVFYIRVGGPGLPVKFITDDDLMASRPQELNPFPSLNDTYNGIRATYPSPDSMWQTTDAPPVYDTAAEAEDGRRLIADVPLPAVSDDGQVQRLMNAWLADSRRMIRHTITLPPEGSIINPLETISWTSDVNGYTNKVFEVAQQDTDSRSLLTQLTIRERDPDDYTWSSGDVISKTPPSNVIVVPTAETLPGWAVQVAQIQDASGTNRRPGLRLVWSGDLPDVEAINFTVRVAATGVVVYRGSTSNVAAQEFIVTQGIISAQTYEARAEIVADRITFPTAWLQATTPDLRITTSDLDVSVTQSIAEASKVPAVSSLPVNGADKGRVVLLTTDQKLYRWTGTQWTTAVPAGDVTGQITGTQISDNAITSAKITANAVNANKIAANAVDANKIAANAVTAGKVAAGAIGATAIAANAVVADKIAADAVTATKIAADAVEAVNIKASNVTTDKINGNAVTSRTFSRVTTAVLTDSVNWVSAHTFNLTRISGFQSSIDVFCEVQFLAAGANDGQCRLLRNGVAMDTYSFKVTDLATTFKFIDTNTSAGTFSYDFQIRSLDVGDNWRLAQSAVTAIQFKR